MNLPDRSTEEGTEYDGFLSYAGEWHALAVGFGLGFAAVMPIPRLKRFAFALVGLDGDMKRTKAFKEAKSESWYAFGGMAFGAALGIVAMLVVAYVGLGVITAVP